MVVSSYQSSLIMDCWPSADSRWQNYNHNHTTWWIILSENTSTDRDMVYRPDRESVVIFGSILCAWSLLCHALLCVIIARKKPFGFSYPIRWLILNFSLAQVLMAAFVVPLSVKTERDGGWTSGPVICRVWLGCGVILIALSLWTLFFITVDRLIYVLRPLQYERRVPRWRVVVMLVCCWLISILTVAPLAISMQDPDFVLDDVCAISMTRNYAFAMSAMSFFGPALITLVVTVVTLVAVCQARHRLRHLRMRAATSIDETDVADDVTSSTCSGGCGPEVTLLTYADYSTIGNVGVTTLCVNLTYVAMWAPFYTTNVLIPLCQDICVDPSVWALLIWVGYASIGVAPVMWFLDCNVREGWRCLVASKARGGSVMVENEPYPNSATICSTGTLDAFRALFKKETGTVV